MVVDSWGSQIPLIYRKQSITPQCIETVVFNYFNKKKKRGSFLSLCSIAKEMEKRQHLRRSFLSYLAPLSTLFSLLHLLFLKPQPPLSIYYQTNTVSRTCFSECNVALFQRGGRNGVRRRGSGGSGGGQRGREEEAQELLLPNEGGDKEAARHRI